MSFDLNRIAAALKAIPRSERPYSIRDASPSDLMSDLGPFILAEVKRAERERACAYEVASNATLSPEQREEAERFASSMFGTSRVNRLARFGNVPHDIAPHVFALMCEWEHRNGAIERERGSGR